MLAIGKTKHGVRGDARTPTCTSCHGESEAHINKPANATERPKPDRTFTKNSQTPVEARNRGLPRRCHQGGKRIHWQGSVHASTRRRVQLLPRRSHAGHDKVRDKDDAAEVCFTCHKEQRADS